MYKLNQLAVTPGEVVRSRTKLWIKPTPLHSVGALKPLGIVSYTRVPTHSSRFWSSVQSKKRWKNGQCSRDSAASFFRAKAWRSFLLPESSPMPAAKAGSATLEICWNAQHATGASKEKTWLTTDRLDIWLFDACTGNQSICLVFRFFWKSVWNHLLVCCCSGRTLARMNL